MQFDWIRSETGVSQSPLSTPHPPPPHTHTPPLFLFLQHHSLIIIIDYNNPSILPLHLHKNPDSLPYPTSMHLAYPLLLLLLFFFFFFFFVAELSFERHYPMRGAIYIRPSDTNRVEEVYTCLVYSGIRLIFFLFTLYKLLPCCRAYF